MFESGVMVLQLLSHSDEAIVAETEAVVCTLINHVIWFSWWLLTSHSFHVKGPESQFP